MSKNEMIATNQHGWIATKEFYRKVLRIILPVCLQQLLNQGANFVDTMMVSYIGYVGAVAVAGEVNNLMLLVSFGVNSGLSVYAAQFYGIRDWKSLRRCFGLFMGLNLLVSGLFFVLVMVGKTRLLSFYSPDMVLVEQAWEYLSVFAVSFFFSAVSNSFSFMYRSVQNPKVPMVIGIGVNLGNALLNYLLIFGKLGLPALGVEGAAVATLLSRVVEFAVCVVYALRSKRLVIHWRSFFRPGWEMTRRFTKYSSPVVLNELAWGTGTSLLTVIYGYTHNSVEMLAANAVTGNLNRLFLVVCFGLGAATAVMVGKAIGEGQSHGDVMSLSHCLLLFTVIVGAGLGLIAIALVPLLFQPVIFPLFKLFGESAQIATALGVAGFAAIPLHAYSISAITGVLRSGGDVNWSTALDLVPQWLLALPLTALFALVWHTGPWLIAIATQAESILKVPLCMWRINSGKWIHDVTVSKEEL